MGSEENKLRQAGINKIGLKNFNSDLCFFYSFCFPTQHAVVRMGNFDGIVFSSMRWADFFTFYLYAGYFFKCFFLRCSVSYFNRVSPSGMQYFSSYI